jgi:hypothetical protein
LMEFWALGLSAVSAFFAAVAALANLAQAKKASQANEVNVYLGLLKEYRSEEMREALASMAKLYRDNAGNVVVWYTMEIQRNPENAQRLYGIARVITSYFVYCAKMYEAGFISKKTFRAIIFHPGINIFYQVAGPLSLAKYPHHDANVYVPILKSFVDKHGDGRIY